MSYQRIFFTNVLHLAVLKGISHQELAERANLSASLMSGITRGKGNPTLSTMSAIAQALETPLGYLLEHHDLDLDNMTILDAEIAEQVTLPNGYEQITAILPKYRAFIVKKWNAESLKSISNKSK